VSVEWSRRSDPRMHVVCVRVFPTTRPFWEVSFALHPGTDVHDARVCTVERQSMVRLVEAKGRCSMCGDDGLVLRERGTVGGVWLCEGCVCVAAYGVISEAMTAAESGKRRA
jgi:hypothetical protein